MSEPTTIIWCTLPSKGNGGAALVTWRDAWECNQTSMSYLLGDKPARYPVPSIYCLSLINKQVDERACDIASFDMLLSSV